jgi:hypothetical protein
MIHIYTYNILGVCLSGHPFHPSVVSFIPLYIHPSSSFRKKKMMEKEEGGGRMAIIVVYPNLLCDPICVQRSLLANLLVVKSLGRCER